MKMNYCLHKQVFFNFHGNPLFGCLFVCLSLWKRGSLTILTSRGFQEFNELFPADVSIMVSVNTLEDLFDQVGFDGYVELGDVPGQLLRLQYLSRLKSSLRKASRMVKKRLK